METTPRGFRYEGQLAGGGTAFEARLELARWYGPLRRRRIRPAVRAGDYQGATVLLLRNAAMFDVERWDPEILRTLIPILLAHAGL